MGGDGTKETEHPKTMIEVMENSRSAIESYAQSQHISEAEAANILIFNELRCIHWHLDAMMTEAKQKI